MPESTRIYVDVGSQTSDSLSESINNDTLKRTELLLSTSLNLNTSSSEALSIFDKTITNIMDAIQDLPRRRIQYLEELNKESLILHKNLKSVELQKVTYLKDLDYQRNSRLPICQLPSEVLCLIFDFIKNIKPYRVQIRKRVPYINQLDEDSEMEDIHWKYQYFHSSSIYWIKQVTHVCRAWREIAISCPSLWNSLSLESSSWTTEMLKRSKEAKLTLQLDFDCHWNVRSPSSVTLASGLLAHIARVTKLIIERVGDLCFDPGNPEFYAIQVSPILPKSAPALQMLILRVLGGGNPRSQYHCDIPNHTFQNTEQLRHFEVMGCAINWGIHLQNKFLLTTLDISDTPLAGRPTISNVCYFLQEMPSLEVLRLRNATIMGSQTPTPKSRISFMCLRELEFTASSGEVEFFFQSANIPLSTSVTVSFNFSDSLQGFSFKGVLHAISSIFDSREAMDSSIYSMDLDGAILGAHIDVYTDIVSKAHSTMPPATPVSIPKLRLTLNAEHHHQISPASPSIKQIWLDLFSTFPLNNIMSTGIHHIEQTHINTVMELAGSLPRLQSLVLSQCHLDHLLSLVNMISDGDSGQTSTMVFPSLQTLTITDTDFDLNSDLIRCSIKIDELVQCLQQRMDKGYAVWKLYLNYCSALKPNDILPLHSCVSHVDWDWVDWDEECMTESEDSDSDMSGSTCPDSDYSYYSEDEIIKDEGDETSFPRLLEDYNPVVRKICHSVP